MNMYLDSERVSPTGNVTSKGIMNQLGRPSLDILAVLVREAVQNSWDARASDSEPVRFGAVGWTLNSVQRRALKKLVFADCPPEQYLPLADQLNQEANFQVMAVYDRGTKGLGGPTRADVPQSDGEARDFVDFLRNVGQPPEKLFSGGTYGFGKAAFYRASLARTICVHTRCFYEGQFESRFMASALGEPFQMDNSRYTGRHWWGQKRGGIAEPLLNRAADDLAQQIGLGTFEQSECGTTILILQPVFGERQPYQALGLAAEYLLWYFWPKMLIYDSSPPRMTFEVSWEGQTIHIPNPADFPPLQGFVQAMRRLKIDGLDTDSPFPFEMQEIAAQRPAKHLGRLVLQKFPVSSPNFFDIGDPDSPFASLTHHTALMRQPELVVKYMPSIVLPNERLGYAGVFIADKDEEVDAAFANAEPPTHDDWIPNSLEERRQKTFVNVALRDISKAMDSFAKPPPTRSSTLALTPLGAFANLLGSSLLPSETGPSALYKPFPSQSPMRPPISIPVQASNIDTADRSMVSLTSEGDNSTQGGSTINEVNSVDSSQTGLVNEPAPMQGLDESVPPTSPAQSESLSTTLLHEPPRYEPPPTSVKPKPIVGRARIEAVSDEYILFNNAPALQVGFIVRHAGNSSGAVVRAIVSAVLEGSQLESEPPIGGSASQVLCWISPDGFEYAGNIEIFVAEQTEGVWKIVVSLPEDVMLNVDLSVEAKAEA